MLACYIAVTVALVALIQSLIYRRRGLKKLTYSRSYYPNRVFEGETVTMTERISNAKLLPMPWVRVESILSPNLRYVAPHKGGEENTKEEKNTVYGEHNAIFSIAPYSSVVRRYTMLCEKRGYYALRAVNITCQEIFGIGNTTSREEAINAVVTVYPRIADMRELSDLSRSLMGDVVVRRWIAEDPFMLRGIREYTPDDPMSKINWKASARTGDFMVNENDYTADIRLLVLFNVQADRFFQTDVDPECIEEGISQAAGLLQYAAEHGIAASFRSNSIDSPLGENRVDFGTGGGHLSEVFTQLACVSRTAKNDFSNFLEEVSAESPSDLGILVMTAYLNDAIESAIEDLRAQGNLVEVALLPRTPGTYGSEQEDAS